ncbi:hypothetical protein ACVWXO_000481 [Bradyrhizobium sp. LM2.7]
MKAEMHALEARKAELTDLLANAEEQSWSRLSEQTFRVDKWSLCRD